MKKTLLILLPICAVLLIIAVTAFAVLLNFTSVSDNEPTTLADADFLSYVQEQWQLNDAEYADGILTVRKSFDITYEQACKLGATIFTDDLAPESYLSLVATLAGDLSSRFSNAPSLIVLRYCSNDGQTIFSVNSSGVISTCWQ